MIDKEVFAIGIGASIGGVEAVMTIASALPANFPAIILVTLHIGSNPSVLPELLRSRGANPAKHAVDGEVPQPGTIYVAPPDRHLLIEDGRIRLNRGPKENHCRPAIDPMFRSLALQFGPRAIGVVLTGFLDDGTAGLKAIKDCGGVAVVQDPATAVEPSMPRSALANVEVDYRVPLDAIAPTLSRLFGAQPASRPGGTAERDVVRREMDMLEGKDNVQNLKAVAEPSSLTCPDCGGSLWELNDRKPLRYRCHTGHAFSAQSLVSAQSETTEHALWSSVRALQEKEMLLRRMARVARTSGDHAQADAGDKQADRAKDEADALVRMIDERGASA